MSSMLPLHSLVLLLALSIPLSAQSPDSTRIPSDSGAQTTTSAIVDTTTLIPHRDGPVATFFNRIGDDIVAQATSPFRMDGGDLLWFGGGVAAGLALYASDESLDRSVRNLKSDYRWIEHSSPIVTELGGTYGIAGVLLFSGYAIAWGTPRDKETTMMFGEVLLATTLWSRAAKILTGRERPSVAYTHPHPDGGTWHGPLSRYINRQGLPTGAFDAFPSGHTTTAFAIATILAGQYNNGWVVPAVAYTAASIVGLSRMVEHAHWASDVFAGACLGYLCGRQIINAHRPDPYFTGVESPNRLHLRFTLAIQDGFPVAGLVGEF